MQIGLNLIKKLTPVAYTWDSRDSSRVGINDIGFLAQDFNGALYGLPQSEYINMVSINEQGDYSLNLSQMFPIYVKAIQEQQAIIESQATEIDDLKSTIQTQQQQIQDLINRITAIENQ